MKNITAQEELLRALKNSRNVKMPDMSIEARKLFYSFQIHWIDLQRRVINGQDIFSEPSTDFKSAAANDV